MQRKGAAYCVSALIHPIREERRDAASASAAWAFSSDKLDYGFGWSCFGGIQGGQVGSFSIRARKARLQSYSMN